ncbi:hypothetical protein Tco_0810947 [Tanacetum coccineum]
MNKKNYSFDLETFRDMLQICPNLPGQKFEDPLFEEDILAFIRELGYPRDIKSLLDPPDSRLILHINLGEHSEPSSTNVSVYGAIIPDTLTNQAMKETEAYKTYHDFATGKVIPKPKTMYDEVSISKDDDDNADDVDDDDQEDDNEQTESDNDGDDFVHPKFSTHDEEERQDEEDKEEEGLDLRVQTPSHFESTDDEAYDEVTQGDRCKIRADERTT